MTNKRKMQRVRRSQTKAIKEYTDYCKNERFKQLVKQYAKPVVPIAPVFVTELMFYDAWSGRRFIASKELLDIVSAFHKMMASE